MVVERDIVETLAFDEVCLDELGGTVEQGRDVWHSHRVRGLGIPISRGHGGLGQGDLGQSCRGRQVRRMLKERGGQ